MSVFNRWDLPWRPVSRTSRSAQRPTSEKPHVSPSHQATVPRKPKPCCDGCVANHPPITYAPVLSVAKSELIAVILMLPGFSPQTRKGWVTRIRGGEGRVVLLCLTQHWPWVV